MLIMKFGGTSIKDVQNILKTLYHIEHACFRKEPILVVVSALSEVTNQLTSLISTKSSEMLEDIRKRHLFLAKSLIQDSNLLTKANDDLENYFWGLKEDLFTDGYVSPRLTAKILAYGELCSSTLIHYTILTRLDNFWLDARKLIITNHNFLNARVNLDLTALHTRQVLSPYLEKYPILITQGFIAGTINGLTTLLGREGSDYSAALLGNILKAREVQIWTDVDGIMTADPKIFPTAKLIDKLSYDEATELSTLGAKVIHPLTIYPVKGLGIPLKILNTRRTKPEGTLISEQSREKFISLNYQSKVVVLGFSIAISLEFINFINRYQSDIFFASFSGNQVIVIMKQVIWKNLKVSYPDWVPNKEYFGSSISITVGGSQVERLKVFREIMASVEEVSFEELVFLPKSILLIVPDEKLIATFKTLCEKLAV